MILLVEDEPDIREAEAAYIRHAGFEVIEAEDGKAALEHLSRSVELVVLDLNLPVMDGLEVCKSIRARSGVPIIMVTARNSDADELLGLHCGADDYLKKPFNPKVLVARIQALLRRSGTTVLTCEPFAMNPETMLLTKHSQAVGLTTTQFNILYKLMQQPGRVFAREQLIEAAHGDVYNYRSIFDRTIDAHIKAIRKKLEDDPSRPQYIQTVIGRGYRFAGKDHD